MIVVKLEDVLKQYNASDVVTNALNRVNLEIDEGEMVAIMGPSGSGKTTMLNIIGCIDTPTSGKCILKDNTIERLSDEKLAKVRNENLGFIFQQFALIPEYTVYENVELPLIYRNLHVGIGKKLSRKEIRKRVMDMLEALGVKEHHYKYPSQLSGGQQQRAAIARALVSEPDIIIADEPTGALDQKNGEEVMKLLTEINEKGKTVIIVTHDEKVAAYCKRKISILDGVIVKDEVIQKVV